MAERIREIVDALKPYRKAVVAWAVPVIIAIQAALNGDGGITTNEVFTVILTALGAGGVQGIANRVNPRKPETAEMSTVT